MAISSRQIGGSTRTALLWQISKQLEQLICIRSGGCESTTSTTSTTTTVYPCPTICALGDIIIGDQTWTGCNLDVTNYQNGDPIPQVQDPTEWAALTTGAWCYYNNDPLDGCTYGKLYNWYAVNDPRGLAPAGYHVPTDTDFTTLYTYLGGEPAAGGALKESGLAHWLTPNTGATNTSGFTALPGGVRNVPSGTFNLIGAYGFWWSATDNGVGVYSLQLLYNDGGVVGWGTPYFKTDGHSVRLIKECAIAFANNNNSLFVTDGSPTTFIEFDSSVSIPQSPSIATTLNKLFVLVNEDNLLQPVRKIYEYDMSYSPNSLTFVREIDYPVGVNSLGNGACALSDTMLVVPIPQCTPDYAVCVNPTPIVKLNISGSVAVIDSTITYLPMFNETTTGGVPTGNVYSNAITGDIIYTTNNKIITLDKNSTWPLVSYIHQYDAITGNLEFERVLDTPLSPTIPRLDGSVGIFVFNSNLYLITNTDPITGAGIQSYIYQVDLTSPYNITSLGQASPLLLYADASNSAGCVNVSFTPSLGIEYCVWSSTDYEVPQISGYDVATNTLVPVPIDNNLIGITSTCTTSEKLWKHDPSTDTIREWFISSYPASLTFNRDITYQNQPSFIKTPIITAVDNNTILTTLNATDATYPNGIPGAVFVYRYDISTNNAGFGTFLFGITAKFYASSMMYTTDSKLIVSAFREINGVNEYYLTQYSYPGGLKEVDISLASIPFNPAAQLSIFWVITYLSEIYLIRTYDSSLFKIDTTYPYAITEVTANLGFSQFRQFESSTGECNNVSFTPRLPECGTTIPNVGGTFTYFGVTGTVTTLSGGVFNYGFLIPGYFAECSGLWQPPYRWIVTNSAPSTIVLTFDSAINNVGIVLSILNLGDNFTITTNTEVPSITMSNSCYATVSGNQIITDPSITYAGGSGQFVITTVTPYTVLTIQTVSGGNGGPIGLSCDTCCSLPDVTIGTQIWTGCNLNVSRYRNGDPIPEVTDAATWNALTTGAWCYYENDTDNGCTYGKLYNWYAVNDPRGLAPTGYHIPSETEVLTLQSYLGGEPAAGGKMKEIGTTHWNSPNTGASNSSGFTALAGGSLVNGQFGGKGISAPFWMTDSSTPTMAYYMDLFNFNANLTIKIFDKVSGHSIRLISDTPAITTTTTTLAPTGFNTIYTHFESL